jgi:hypothetical protein
LGPALGLGVKSVRASLRLTDSLGSVVLLYPGYRSVEFPLDVLRRAGREAEIGQFLQTLQNIPGITKQVSTKCPTSALLKRSPTGRRSPTRSYA